MRTVFIEALAVAILGAVLGLTANVLSPKGLALSRNYFPIATNLLTFSATNSSTVSGSSGTNSGADAVLRRLAAQGIQLVGSNYVSQAFNDPRRLNHLLIFIDAREGSYYQQGHIPGAYQFDYYRPEPYLPVVLPAAQAAETVIIYCNGGDCEDSEFAAIFLRDAGVPSQKLQVYGGGFGEWATNRLPVEVGERNSGRLRP